MDSKQLSDWLTKIKVRDPALHKRISARISKQGPVAETHIVESAGGPSAARADFALETIVMETGRPAIPIIENKVSYADAHIDDDSGEVVQRLRDNHSVIEPVIPLIGRIDVTNFAGNIDYVGTGWQIEPNIVVTNRHVAELIAKRDGRKFVFKPGRFGDPLEVSMDYLHELRSSAQEKAAVEEVIWIEEDKLKADIAFLKIANRGDGSHQNHIGLADRDAAPGDQVAVIGYPARAPSHIIRDQDLMDRIYGKTYDIKRIAPGLMDDDSRGWATHDCTTLGGKSGSPVIDVGTGKVVALHFAGLYLIENYAVPVSTIKQYLRDRPWQNNGPAVETGDTRQPAGPAAGLQSPATAAGNTASLTIPVTISVSIGDGSGADLKITSGATGQDTPALSVEAAARKLWQQKSGNGILNIASSYLVSNGKFTDDECITVWVHPDKLHEAAAYIGTDSFAGYPVTVEPASIDDQISPGGMGDALAEAAVTSIAYNDADRTGKGFRFDEVNEMMEVTCHVGPERSWEVLSGFLQETRQELISSIYQFHAKHIATVIGSELDDNAKLKLVMDLRSNDPRDDEHHIGDFDRSDMFASWENQHGDRFDAIYAPKGSSGLVAYSYHIKVTVRDSKTFWLSSGNWKRHSQPIIPDDKRNDPKFTIRKGNREWHVVIENKKLASLFRNHIIADFEQCRQLGGSLEAPLPDEVFVDVPEASFISEAVELEATPPPEILEPLTVRRKVKVKPLLTPDDEGAVYSEAVLDLIRSAKTQLVFQNQYIKMKGAKFGFLKELVDALVAKSQQLDDFRLILRSSVDKQDLAELKKRGMDVNTQVRQVSKTHTKGIVVDGKRVLVGSHNWSASGVSLNRDASLIFDDSEIAGYFLQAFERDWARARQLTVPEAIVAECPRIAFRDSPVPGGFRRMRLEDYLDD